jgi:hypothetical protein
MKMVMGCDQGRVWVVGLVCYIGTSGLLNDANNNRLISITGRWFVKWWSPKTWEKRLLPNYRYNSDICIEGPGRIVKEPSHDQPVSVPRLEPPIFWLHVKHYLLSWLAVWDVVIVCTERLSKTQTFLIQDSRYQDRHSVLANPGCT